MTEWFTAAEIAKLMGWRIGYVQRLASRDRWRRLGTRPQRYFIHDVHREALGVSACAPDLQGSN